ncbi:MAG: phosphoribosylanthranilate isomerase [Homoserinimonas sp.]|nr:phosphoribosylanthranilate isomerase [Homoserinimonas sp.]
MHSPDPPVTYGRSDDCDTGGMVFVKICGLREAHDVEVALASGADAIGFVLTQSPRYITATQARPLVAAVGHRALSVAVFRDETVEHIEALAAEAGVNAIQVHGSRTREEMARLAQLGVIIIRAVPFDAESDGLGADMLLVDAPRPGSGEQWDYSTLRDRKLTGRWFLAGGLTPCNVAAAIATSSPWGVDVSSGVESSPGRKDPAMIRDFVTAAKS